MCSVHSFIDKMCYLRRGVKEVNRNKKKPGDNIFNNIPSHSVRCMALPSSSVLMISFIFSIVSNGLET